MAAPAAADRPAGRGGRHAGPAARAAAGAGRPERRGGRRGGHLGRRGDADRRPRPTRCAAVPTATRSSSSSTPGWPARAATWPRCSPRSTRRPRSTTCCRDGSRPLPEPTVAALRRACVVGREFDVPTLAAVLGTTEDTVLDDLEPALAAGLVGEFGVDRFRFAHALVRDTAYAGLSRSRRGRMHARTAEVLAGVPGRENEVARHWLAAGPSYADRAWRAARSAATAALELYAYDEAVSLLSGALTALDDDPAATGEERFDLLLALARSHLLTDDLVRLRETVHRALVAAGGDPARELAAVGLLVTKALWQSGRFGQIDEVVVGTIRRCLDALPEGDSEARCRAMIGARDRDLLRFLGPGARGALRAGAGDGPPARGRAGAARHPARGAPQHLEPRHGRRAARPHRRGRRAGATARGRGVARHRAGAARQRGVGVRPRRGAARAGRGGARAGDAGAAALRPAVPRRAGDPVAGDARRAGPGAGADRRHGGPGRTHRRPPGGGRPGRRHPDGPALGRTGRRAARDGRPGRAGEGAARRGVAGPDAGARRAGRGGARAAPHRAAGAVRRLVVLAADAVAGGRGGDADRRARGRRDGVRAAGAVRRTARGGRLGHGRRGRRPLPRDRRPRDRRAGPGHPARGRCRPPVRRVGAPARRVVVRAPARGVRLLRPRAGRPAPGDGRTGGGSAARPPGSRARSWRRPGRAPRAGGRRPPTGRPAPPCRG